MKTRKWFYYILAFWLISVLAFGLWWLYLLQELGSQLGALNVENLNYPRMLRMLQYEGSTFILFLLSGGLFVGWIYFQDIRKSRSIQAFFSSLTHELKTPLASMRLQAEVIEDNLQNQLSPQKLPTLSKRLLEDLKSLETQMDKALQLARLEQGGEFYLTNIPLLDFLEDILKDYSKKYQITYNVSSQIVIQGDAFGLELIFKNFIENTKRHQKECKHITITAAKESHRCMLTYNDHGSPFSGDKKKLGELFYKHESHQGTGVGLYLCKKLTHAMGGVFEMTYKPNLAFHLLLKVADK